MKKVIIISISDAFAMGWSEGTGHKIGHDVSYSDGSVIREVYDENNQLVDEIVIC